MNTTTPVATYRQQIEQRTTELAGVRQRKNFIAWARLAAIIAGVASCYLLWNTNLVIALLAAAVCLAIFLRLVAVAIGLLQKQEHLEHLIAVNQQEINTAAGYYYDQEDGSQYLPETHHYAYDLDILGRASLFQYINRTTTGQGGNFLANWLLNPANAATILQRQAAVKELAPQTIWRQELQAYGMGKNISLGTQQRIADWFSADDRYFQKLFWKIIRWIGPLAAFTILGIYIADIISYQAFLLWLLFFFSVTGFISKKATPAYHALNKIAPEIATLSAMIDHIEKENFESDWLKAKQQHFFQATEKASAAVRLLNRILSRMDYRLNPVAFIPLNIFLFWDLQQMLSFEKWRRNYAMHIHSWFETVGEMEAISSIATIAFNHPDWAFPLLKKEHGYFSATNLGHPLIAAEKVVKSSFVMEGNGKIAIITGSNMAGKSTFLRSVGLTLVMGQAGAPVCATEAALSCMQVISTMRISDNLEESTSTFYAELKKLKNIIDAVNAGEKVFLLMDEILRGTNSLDRHTGSKALIRQLIRYHASGIIATHDLALAELQKQYPQQIDNYHFDVQVAADELYFDYKLKNGVCQSLNASVLMKKIGIEMES